MIIHQDSAYVLVKSSNFTCFVWVLFLVLKGFFSHIKIPLISLFNLFMYSQLRVHAFLH